MIGVCSSKTTVISLCICAHLACLLHLQTARDLSKACPRVIAKSATAVESTLYAVARQWVRNTSREDCSRRSNVGILLPSFNFDPSSHDLDSTPGSDDYDVDSNSSLFKNIHLYLIFLSAIFIYLLIHN